MSALAASDVPVPTVLGLGQVSGREAACMTFLRGTSLTSAAVLRDPIWRTRADVVLASAAATLAQLHAVDVAGVGLQDLSPTTPYVPRQIRRWSRQIETAESGLRDSLMAQAEQLLTHDTVPLGIALVHGDYHLANLLLDEDGEVTGVVDWELAALGDPHADLATFLAYLDRDLWDWRLSSSRMQAQDSVELGVILDAYFGEETPDARSLGHYLAWAHWRIACIGVGVQARGDAHDAGARAENPSGDVLPLRIRRHLDASRRLLRSPQLF